MRHFFKVGYFMNNQNEQDTIIRYGYTNRFIFSQIMQDEETVREILERIFPERSISDLHLHEVEALSSEKEIQASPESHGVRFDVLFEGDKEWYDIEMQVEHQKNLPKRARYYHSMMDEAQLKRGHNYRELKPHYVIFICVFDPFGIGEAVYEFEAFNFKNNLPLGDESYTIILNTTCSEFKIPEPLKSYFMYVSGRTVDEDDGLIHKIHDQVMEYNRDPVWRDKIMTLAEVIEEEKEIASEEAYKKGKAEGIAEGKSEVAKNLKDTGLPIDAISKATGLTAEEINSL